LGAPRRERIGLMALEHVAHSQAELIEIVLDAQQRERVAAGAIDEITLQHLETCNLTRQIHGVPRNGRQRKHEADDQAGRRRRLPPRTSYFTLRTSHPSSLPASRGIEQAGVHATLRVEN